MSLDEDLKCAKVATAYLRSFGLPLDAVVVAPCPRCGEVVDVWVVPMDDPPTWAFECDDCGTVYTDPMPDRSVAPAACRRVGSTAREEPTDGPYDEA